MDPTRKKMLLDWLDETGLDKLKNEPMENLRRTVHVTNMMTKVRNVREEDLLNEKTNTSLKAENTGSPEQIDDNFGENNENTLELVDETTVRNETGLNNEYLNMRLQRARMIKSILEATANGIKKGFNIRKYRQRDMIPKEENWYRPRHHSFRYIVPNRAIERLNDQNKIKRT